MSSTIIIITPPLPDDPEGRSSAPASRVRVTIEYDPPEFMDEKTVKRTEKKLRKAAEKIVAQYG